MESAELVQMLLLQGQTDQDPFWLGFDELALERNLGFFSGFLLFSFIDVKKKDTSSSFREQNDI